MEQFISVIIFSLPGLITYFWIQWLGINPAVKHTPTEMVGISALLWAPTTFLTILTYNVVFYFFDSFFRIINVNLTVLQLDYLLNLNDLNKLSLNLLFLFFYVLLSVFFSFIVAVIWSNWLYKRTLDFVNKIRIKRNMIKLSVDSSVWDSFFFKLEEKKESQIVVELYKIDKPEEKICGPVIRMSRPFETDRSLIIDSSKGWDESHRHYKYPSKKIYVDTKSGMIINELDVDNPKVKK